MSEMNAATAAARPELDALARLLDETAPAADQDALRIAVAVYRLLAEGEPVPRERVARSAVLPLRKVDEVLDAWPGVYADAQGRIVGFWGLTIGETQHRLEVDGRTLYTWCALDTLFIPAILGRTARVTSRSPGGGAVVLEISEEGVRNLSGGEVVMSLLLPDPQKLRENVISAFCHHIHFFPSPETGEAWVARRRGTFLLALDEAYRLARRLGRGRYGDLLARGGKASGAEVERGP